MFQTVHVPEPNRKYANLSKKKQSSTIMLVSVSRVKYPPSTSEEFYIGQISHTTESDLRCLLRATAY